MSSSSTQVVVVERPAERVEKPSHFPTPQPTTRPPRVVIKLSGSIPG